MKSKDWHDIQDQIFLIPDTEDRYILYAPLADFAAQINTSLADTVRSYILSEGTYPVPVSTAMALGNFDWLRPAHSYLSRPRSTKKFLPTMVTLFPTTRCNLACTYCYADAGTNARSLKMGLPAAQSAIRFIVKNAVKTGCEQVRLGFHGGGEPLLERSFVQTCIDYARVLCDQHQLSLRLVAATNGCLDESTMEWIGDTFDGLSLSCDGPDFIQNTQRPFPNGAGSWEVLSRNVKKLQNRKTQFGVRVTLTDQSAPYAGDIVRFFAEQWNVYDIHFEPLYQRGRARTSAFNAPTTEQFVTAFKDAYSVSQSLNARLQYSGTRLGEIHSSFCEVDGQSFSVTPDGYVTACFEITDSQKEGADVFLYGKYEPGTDTFVFDKKKREHLRNLNLETKSFCKHCFCRWNCAGDCPAKCPQVQTKGIDEYKESPGARCEINRAITLFLLKERLTQLVIHQPKVPGSNET